MRILVPLLLALLATAPAGAQVVVHGTVTDAATGERLPAATVQVEGTTAGTITNAEGNFEVVVRAAPASLLVRYIGYASERVDVGAIPERQRVDVELTPAPVTYAEVVVTGDDPAENIMRRVIEAKARWQARLATWRADAYARQTIARDTGIVAITEGATTAYWRRGDGVREVVRGVRQTANIDFLDPEVMRAADAVINLYDDEIPFAGYRLPGPTSPQALSFYRFRLDSIRTRDDQLVYDIAMEPRSRLQPGFEGRVSVLGDDWVIIDAGLRPNEVVRFPGVPVFDFSMAQQFIGVTADGGSVWLPADYRVEGRLGLRVPGIRFPDVHFRSVIRLTDYEVNVPVPDSLFVGERRPFVDEAAVEADTVLDRTGLIVPLEPREAAAYATIDTTASLLEAFQPTGPLARLVRMQIGDEETSERRRPGNFRVAPHARFNRVEAAHLGADLEVTAPAGMIFGGGAAYATGLKDVTYSIRASFASGARGLAPYARAEYHREHAPFGGATFYPHVVTSVATLLGGPDYYDYFRRQGLAVEAGVRVRRQRVRVGLGGFLEDHRALPVTSGYDLLGRSGEPRPNPPADEGRLHAAALTAVWGSDPVAFGNRLLPGRGAALNVEAADAGLLGGDFSYLRTDLTLHTRLATGLRRRLMPMMLDLRLSGGTSTGDLPAQRSFSVDGSTLLLSPAGTLTSLHGLRASGARYLLGTWEHNFRSVPLELVGLTRLADLGFSLHVRGGHGRTWETPAAAVGLPDWRHEVGIGVSGGLTVPLRVDVTARLDAPGFFLTIGLPSLL